VVGIQVAGSPAYALQQWNEVCGYPASANKEQNASSKNLHPPDGLGRPPDYGKEDDCPQASNGTRDSRSEDHHYASSYDRCCINSYVNDPQASNPSYHHGTFDHCSQACNSSYHHGTHDHCSSQASYSSYHHGTRYYCT